VDDEIDTHVPSMQLLPGSHPPPGVHAQPLLPVGQSVPPPPPHAAPTAAPSKKAHVEVTRPDIAIDRTASVAVASVRHARRARNRASRSQNFPTEVDHTRAMAYFICAGS
jgi:hypothetical protein